MKVWILTSEVNAYDQYGEYFEDVFKDKPTDQYLSDRIGRILESEEVQGLINKGSSYVYGAHSWYKLKEEELK